MRLYQATAWILVVLFPAAMCAQPAQGTLQAQGLVSVNGSRVSTSTSVFTGDKVETGGDSSAIISSQGTLVHLGPNTTAIFSERMVDLGCGSALVTTSMGEVVRVSGVTVTPGSQGTSKFQVSQGAGALKVTAEQGSVVVDDGAKHMLASGQSYDRKRAGGSCTAPLAAVPQGSTKIYIPAAAVAVGSAIFAWCSVNWFCSETSPSAP